MGQAISDGVDEPSLLRLDPDEMLKLEEQDSTILISTSTLPKTVIELPTKNYLNKNFIDPSIIRNTADADFKNKNLDNVRFVKTNSMPAVGALLKAKYYVDKAIFYSVNEASFLR